VAEEQKRQQQVEAFIRKSKPQSAHVSWIDRLNPYRLMKAHHHSIRVTTLPPNLVLPLKQNVGPEVGAPPEVDTIADLNGAKGAMWRLLGRAKDTHAMPLRTLHRPVSATFEDLDEEFEDERGL
jgi:hypothetical protein